MDARKTGPRYQSQRQAHLIVLRTSMRKFALPWLSAGLKPSFSAFRLLRTLGDERIPEAASDVLITKKKDGTLVLAAWNFADPGATVAAKSITFTLQGVKG